MSPNQYVSDLRAEVAALRAVVARVEELAAEMRGDRFGTPGPAYLYAAERIRIALGSTDSDPAATERQGEAGGAESGS